MWKKLGDISKSVGGPWVVAGDFNEMASYMDKEGGLPIEPRRIVTFRGMMDECKLRSVATKGVSYTWCNLRSEEGVVRERIDRFLANAEWNFSCPMSLVDQLPILGSDHSPLVLQFKFQDKVGKRPFRFELTWSREKECAEVVRKGWTCQVMGYLGFRVVKKLRIC